MTTSTAGLAPGVSIRFVEPPPPVAPVAIDVPAFVCVCERGPLDTPTRIGSWPAFVATFGTFIVNGLGAYAVKAFFDNGGRVCWIVRVAAPAVVTGPNGAQPADRLSSIVNHVTGFVVGAAVTVSQGREVHQYLLRAVDPATATLSWDRPLHPAFNLTLSFDVATGAGASTVTLTDAAGADSLRIAASSPGAWGDRLALLVTPGRRAATANRLNEPAGPLAIPVQGTDGFTTGSTVSVVQDLAGVVTTTAAVVQRVDPVDRVLWWSAPLPATIDPLKPMRLETDTMSLTVQRSGVAVEVWADLSVVASHPRYAPTILASSAYVGSVEVFGANLPAVGWFRLAGGRDGTAALSTADLIGDELLGDGHGVAALVEVDEPAAVAIPDLVAGPTAATVTLPPPEDTDPCAPCQPAPAPPSALEAVITEAGASFDDEQIVAAQQALIDSCTSNTERIALLDPPAGPGPTTVAELRSWASRFASDYAVATIPWLTVIDPLSASGAVRRVPPCGHVAGMIAQTDAADGPWLAPANRSLNWAYGVDTAINTPQHATLNDAGVDVIRALPGRGLVPMGARTLSTDTLWVFVPVRRAMIYLRRALRVSLAWVVFEPNGPGLAAVLSTAIGTLLRDVWEAGGLSGDTPDDAFFVHVDQSGAAVGQLLIVIGVALTRPAEFVTVQVSRVENRLELSEAPQLVIPGGAS
jgi:hypothetical protein